MARSPKPRCINKKILESENDWLDDNLINASQNLLKKQYPQFGGFQNTLFGQNLSFKVERGAFVQIIHSRNHWVCITNTACNKGEMEVIDSMFDTLPQKAVNQVAAFVHRELPALNLKFLNTQRQRGYSDCGLYAIATATAICEGKDPCTQLFCQEYMRSHLSQCLKMGKTILFPAKERNVSIGSRVKTTQIVKLFCHCRQPSYGNIIQCKNVLTSSMDSVSQFLQSTGKTHTLGTAEDVPRYKEVLHKYYPSTFQNAYIINSYFKC